MRKRNINLLLLGVIAMALPCNTLAQATVTIGTGDLYKSFVNPPGAAQPRVWWHWLDGNISRAGIRKDLMWMHRVGIGGLACIDAGIHTPLIVKNRVAYMSPEWKEAMHYATYLTDSLGMEFTMPAVAGWSESGAPWVSPKDAMKKLTWREITVKGGKTFKGKLPEPFNTTGMFQNISKLSDQYSIPTKEPYYHDITVIAYRLPDDDLTMLEMNPRVKASNGLFSLQQLTNGDYSDNAVLRPAAKGQDSWILFDFGKPRTIKSVSLTDDHQTVSSFESVDVPGTRFIEVSDNGVSFHRVAEIRPTKVPSVTSSIPATTARFFRVLYKASKADSTNVSEIQLYTTDRINHAEDKAGFGISTILASYKTPSTTDAVKASDVIDITSDVDAQGNISWKAPKGKWRIVRFGYSLAGSTNHPAVPEATGLEVDKLDSAAVRNYFTTYINMYKDATKGLMGKHGIQNILTDSYESGPENWTPLMRERFKEIAGYDMTPWLPVLTGQIVGSTEESERFLWDFRKVIGKLFVKYHYDQLTDIAKEYGMEGRYSESDEGGRTYLPDGMEVKRSAAFPMSATWCNVPPHDATACGSDIREAASVAHIYGQNIVAAESFTTVGFGGNGWNYYPSKLKAAADQELYGGVNRFAIHESGHQPVDDKVPGLGVLVTGQWFNRHETWAEQAKAWTDYLGRSSALLQQGKYVADVLYYYGEDNNITNIFNQGKFPMMPEGYSFDFTNAEALINNINPSNGSLTTKTGMRYRVLVLNNSASVKNMSLPVLRKIDEIARAGVLICGARPETDASLSDDKAEFNRLVDDIWNSGRANVSTSTDVASLLRTAGIQADFSYDKSTTDPLRFVHRHVSNGDIYWVNKPSANACTASATFRVSGKRPEIWHPETGLREAASYEMGDGTTTVTIPMVQNDAVFVVFTDDTADRSYTVAPKTDTNIATVKGPWSISFVSKAVTPQPTTMQALASLSSSSDRDIKYFSGTASYANTVKLSKSQLKVGRIILDLGKVCNLAEVIVNGRILGTVWKAPFRVDITDAVKAGKNSIVIKVTDSWANRLIGDQRPDTMNKSTYTSFNFYNAKSPLNDAGLVGPVKLLSEKAE